MPRIFPAAALAVISIAFSAGQSVSGISAPAVSLSGVSAPPHPSWLTDQVVFDFLFRHVMIMESRANQLVAQGKDDSSQRHYFKNAATLTDQEESLLKSTAAANQTAMSAFAANQQSVVSSIKAQYPNQNQLPASATQQLQALAAQKGQILQTYMASLQSGMSASEFQRFYNFAWGTEGPRIRLAQPGAKPPTGARAPLPKQ